MLNGSYQSRLWSGNVTAHGQYTFGEYYVRPKVSVSYAHGENDAYDLEGDIIGIPVEVRFPKYDDNYGVMDFSTEFSRIFTLRNGGRLMPYIELGVAYEFERPNDGKILTSDLTWKTTSAWSGNVRVGARALVAENLQIDASAGYLSIGHDDLNVWEGKLQISYGF